MSHKISIMTFDDQFSVAEAVLGFLESLDLNLSEEKEDELIDVVMAMTDDFSIGCNEIVSSC